MASLDTAIAQTESRMDRHGIDLRDPGEDAARPDGTGRGWQTSGDILRMDPPEYGSRPAPSA